MSRAECKNLYLKMIRNCGSSHVNDPQNLIKEALYLYHHDLIVKMLSKCNLFLFIAFDKFPCCLLNLTIRS